MMQYVCTLAIKVLESGNGEQFIEGFAKETLAMKHKEKAATL